MKKIINKNKKFLIVVATHGDEIFSLPAVQKLKKQFPNKFDYIIGNLKALKQKKRFTDIDLNRVAPGKKNSKLYEEKRVFEIIEKTKNFQFMLDIHGTSSQSGIFTLVTNPTSSNMFLAYSLPIQKIVIWGSKNNGRSTGPISRFVSCGVGIECGPMNSLNTKEELYKKLESFIKSPKINYQEINKKDLYQVFGNIKENDVNGKVKKRLKDFKEININDQKFFPLLVNQYKSEKIVCYKLKKVDFYEKFSFPY